MRWRHAAADPRLFTAVVNVGAILERLDHAPDGFCKQRFDDRLKKTGIEFEIHVEVDFASVEVRKKPPFVGQIPEWAFSIFYIDLKGFQIKLNMRREALGTCETR